jgi:hypothetical protein
VAALLKMVFDSLREFRDEIALCIAHQLSANLFAVYFDDAEWCRHLVLPFL